ncbi:hypothetical protein J5N97_026533 [Dioscorea zingiberensis]|uniref:Uncharacterized protein n=1 Tax=Dioscorea zingiberensis TaxID=325984 RepID=A0A9D5C2X8_9LILI|nr:hypothetical protein J5N97_026533 [Dioscorea zingiberensis]
MDLSQPLAIFTGAIVSQYSATLSPRNGLAFASSELIAASHISLSAAGFIHLFNWWSSSVLRSIPVLEPVAPLVATPQGSYLFAGGLSGIASGCTGGCNSIFITCSLDCMIKFWSLANGACLRTVHLECGKWSVIMDSTNAKAYVGGYDGRVYVVPVKIMRRRFSGEEDREVVAWLAEESGGAVIALAMLNGDQNVASASEDGVMTIWDSRQVVWVVRYGRSSISGLLVVKGVSRATRVRRDVAVGFNVVGRMSLVEGMYKVVKEVEEMEECLNVVVKDRRRASH